MEHCPATQGEEPVRLRTAVPGETGSPARIICSLTVVVLLLFAVFSDVSPAADKTVVQVGKQPEIQQVKPRKPVRIRLRRTAKGEYSWDLTGDSVEELVKTDRNLRKLLKLEEREK